MNMNYDLLYQPYASNRYPVIAKEGMVSTGSALASSAGLEILRKGGNAVDAAVATAATLTVVEPTANGLGSDAFAIVWMKDKMYGLNASGYSPKHISIDALNRKGIKREIPTHGWLPVMVPGAVKGWKELIERFGNLTLKEVLEPAIRYAEEGFPVSASIANSWNKAIESYHENCDGKKEFDEFFKTFEKSDGNPYEAGEIIKLPNHAKTLKLLADTNTDAFYKGEIANQFIKQSLKYGGYFCKDDLESYECEWVEPISVNYRGYDVWELPPNGHGIVALMALNILKEFEFDSRDSAETIHKQLEAIKIAFADAKRYVTDKDKMTMDYNRLILPEYGSMRSKEISVMSSIPYPSVPPKSGTVYLCTGDKEGNMVSFIQSNYRGFGSGIVLEGYGVALNNRGLDFSLSSEDINCLEERKKCYHTIIPGFLCKDGKAIGPFGVMGGYMQPQGHVQVLMNMIDFNLNPQMALDAPRWQWLEGRKVIVEDGFKEEVIQELIDRGHDIEVSYRSSLFGRGQIINRKENGVYVGGCESRTDSNIAIY